MNYKLSIEKQNFITKVETLAAEERRITVELIQCLEEISKQMIYAEMGYESLHAFCVRYLKMSEGAAYRRISAMRLSQDVPVVKEKILSGELSLTNASKIQTAAKKSPRKAEIVGSCLNLTQKECEINLFKEIPELREQFSHAEKTRQLDEEHTELKLVLSQDLKSKIDELQNLLSHSNPEKSCLKLLERLVDQELKRIKKKTEPKNTQIEYKPTDLAAGQAPLYKSRENPRYIPADLERLVWSRAKNKCQHPGCNSRYKIQIDHVIPFGKGGETIAENLQLLCRTHNILKAKKDFGDKKIERYMSCT